MQFLIAELIGALAVAMASLVGRVLFALGMNFITFVGITALVAAVKARVFSSMSGLPADIVGLLGYMWVDKAITAVFSAWTAALALKLAGSDSITSMIQGKK